MAEAAERRLCSYCMHSEVVHGHEQVVLICANRPGYRGLWYAVGRQDTCARFKETGDRNRVGTAGPTQSGVRVVPLSQGKFALVDERDYAAVMKYSWYAQQSYKRSSREPLRTNPLPPSGYSPLAGGELNSTFYAVRKDGGRTVRMHREIMGAAKGEVVDHINHDGLDNRRCNLRVCSHAENVRNQRGQLGRSSRYKGVSRDRRLGKWRAQIWHNGKHTYLGLFELEAAAAQAYNAKARELFGEFAYLNDVEERTTNGHE